MDSVEIPYYAPFEELPSELPTKEMIENSKDVLCEQSARKVVGIGPYFVVKYGVQADLEEGRNMIFVKNMTSVSVPKVYALYKDVESNKKYIIMERIGWRSSEFHLDFVGPQEKAGRCFTDQSMLD